MEMDQNCFQLTRTHTRKRSINAIEQLTPIFHDHTHKTHIDTVLVVNDDDGDGDVDRRMRCHF